ncbi:MAG: hypothetical protein L6R42_004947 [Xanthoria sp. 1 TBL-2021]|nr:MAG: hypothetical protein L6R42_004947 [Xanthoria sp. 1 TBL-2021]
MMATPTVDQFLDGIARLMKQKDGAQIQDFLHYEPPWPPIYERMVAELRQTYTAAEHNGLERKCSSALPPHEEGDGGGSFTSFISFVAKYFAFIRDVDVSQLLETHDKLKALLGQASIALSASTGVLILPTVISLSRTLSKLAIGLDKRPDLVANLTSREAAIGAEEAGERVTLAEGSANLIREAFKKCASERSGNLSGLDNSGKPEGRRIGIYLMANVCLKLFFHCRKLRSAEQIFALIYQQSPPLSLYPAAQRTTFLYYLGRYHFANNHFYRAQLALQEAYYQCHRQATKQRRLILIYLITSNIILGRFPKQHIYQRPEAQGLQEKFEPICGALAKGDIASFRKLTDIDNPSAAWFLHWRILLQITNRCEVILWRSLARRTFLLSGNRGNVSRRTAPTLSIEDIFILATFLEKRALGIGSEPSDDATSQKASRGEHTNSIFIFPPTPADTPPAQADDNSVAPHGYIDPDLLDLVDHPDPALHTIETVESMVASLIDQDLLHGFISHSQKRFAITGAKNAAPLAVGFPNVWATLKAKMDDEVPGWVKEGQKRGGGTVMHLSGARPVGA